jgi:hypothetical protein
VPCSLPPSFLSTLREAPSIGAQRRRWSSTTGPLRPYNGRVVAAFAASQGMTSTARLSTTAGAGQLESSAILAAALPDVRHQRPCMYPADMEAGKSDVVSARGTAGSCASPPHRAPMRRARMTDRRGPRWANLGEKGKRGKGHNYTREKHAEVIRKITFATCHV